MATGPERILESVHLGALNANTEYSGWTNPFSEATDVYEIEHATFNQLDAITGTATHNWGVFIDFVTTAGVHSTCIGSLAYQSGTNHTAYIADDLTMASSGLQIAPNEGFNVRVVDGGTQPAMSADAKVDVILVKGATSAA